MKKIVKTSILLLIIVFASCKNNQSENKSNEEITKAIPKSNESSFSIGAILNDYLKLKNALVADDSKEAALAGNDLLTTFNSVNLDLIDAKYKKEYLEIAEDSKENAEHIKENAGEIAHQREHFAILSKDMSDLIAIFGAPQKLYQDYCPMYDEGKSGYWISETDKIRNPYYGSEMLSCGEVKKEL